LASRWRLFCLIEKKEIEACYYSNFWALKRQRRMRALNYTRPLQWVTFNSFDTSGCKCHYLSIFFIHMTEWKTFGMNESNFYRAMLCIRGTSHGSVSVCLSVTSRSSTKTAKRRITQTTPHDSPGTLVFWCQRFLRNLTVVTPYGGAKCRCSGSISATFDK